MNATDYTPEPGSPADRVLDLLARNPQEEYSSSNLALKFQVPKAKWDILLVDAVAKGLIHREKLAGESSPTWCAGAGLKVWAAQRKGAAMPPSWNASEAKTKRPRAAAPLLAELWGVKETSQLNKRLDTMTAPELTQLLMDCAIVDDVQASWHNVDNSKPGPLLALANHYGIDAKAVMQASVRSPAEATKATPTPSTAGARAKQSAAAGAVKKSKPAVKYRCPATGNTWSGRGLMPVWLKAAMASGGRLDDFLADKAKEVKVEAGSAGQRCAHTGDLLEAAGV